MTLPEQLSLAVQEWIASGGEQKKADAVLAILADPDHEVLPYAQRNADFVTSSKLKDLKACPYHAFLKHVRRLETGYQEPEHFVIGRAFDFLMTHGREGYARKFVTVDERIPDLDSAIAEQEQKIVTSHGKLNKDGTRSKVGIDMEERANEKIALLQTLRGKVQLTNSQGELIDRMEREYLSRECFPRQLTKRNLIWLMFGSVPCKAELDHFSLETGRVGDLKTTANLNTFDPVESHALQMSFYSFGVEKVLDESPEIELYVVDKHPQWSRSHLWVFSRPTLRERYFELEKLAQQWVECSEMDLWPHVNVDSLEGREVCWDHNNECYDHCPFCKQLSPIVI